MTRHEDVYYTCNGCGERLSDDAWTEVLATNTDPAAQQPTHKYDLCATCWLKVYPLLDGVRIRQERQRHEDADREHAEYDQFCYENPEFEG